MSDLTKSSEKAKGNLATHTPPPWCWRQFGDKWALTTTHSGALIILDYIRRGYKVELRVRDQDRCLMVPFDPNHPDARLIEAAPLLLAAAKHALAALTDDDLDEQDAIDALEQAIDAAGGRPLP